MYLIKVCKIVCKWNASLVLCCVESESREDYSVIVGFT